MIYFEKMLKLQKLQKLSQLKFYYRFTMACDTLTLKNYATVILQAQNYKEFQNGQFYDFGQDFALLILSRF